MIEKIKEVLKEENLIDLTIDEIMLQLLGLEQYYKFKYQYEIYVKRVPLHKEHKDMFGKALITFRDSSVGSKLVINGFTKLSNILIDIVKEDVTKLNETLNNIQFSNFFNIKNILIENNFMELTLEESLRKLLGLEQYYIFEKHLEIYKSGLNTYTPEMNDMIANDEELSVTTTSGEDMLKLLVDLLYIFEPVKSPYFIYKKSNKYISDIFIEYLLDNYNNINLKLSEI